MHTYNAFMITNHTELCHDPHTTISYNSELNIYKNVSSVLVNIGECVMKISGTVLVAIIFVILM